MPPFDIIRDSAPVANAPAAFRLKPAQEIPRIEHCIAPIGALTIDPAWHDLQPTKVLLDARKRSDLPAGEVRRAPARLKLDGRLMLTSKRFWTSLFRRCGFSDGIFRYYAPAEVFERVAQRDAGTGLRFAVEHLSGREPRLLAVSSPKAPLLQRDDAVNIIDANGGSGVMYSDGRLHSAHVPADGPNAFRIGPDKFEQRFAVDVPLDGLGMPTIHPMLLRLVCVNGAVALQRALRSDIRLGERPEHALDRALSSFGNADGFSAMRQRFERAQNSFASIDEVRRLETVLDRGNWGAGEGRQKHREAFHRMVGDLYGIYGVTSLDSISPKRRRLLPARCRIYDMINFASEMASHHAPPMLAQRLSGWIGSTICDEYDLEGTADNVGEFEALFTTEASAVGGVG